MLKINLGSNNKKIGEDFLNVDGLDLPNVDAKTDLSVTPFRLIIKNKDKFSDLEFLSTSNLEGIVPFTFPDNSVDEIVMDEVLEHISFRLTHKVLKEIYRILKPGGKISIQVPDCGKAMEAWVNGKVCNCVPHKPETISGFKGNPDCEKCHGEAIMDFERFIFSFTGAQKHPLDIHRAIFTKKLLEREISQAGFQNYSFQDNPVKLKVKCFK